MTDKYKDTDLREALRRKYADTPKLPADFMKGAFPQPLPSREGRTRILRWMAAAACLLLICGVGVTLLHKEDVTKPEQMVAQQTKSKTVSMADGHSSGSGDFATRQDVAGNPSLGSAASLNEESLPVKQNNRIANPYTHSRRTINPVEQENVSIVHSSKPGGTSVVASAGTPLPSRGGAGVGSVMPTAPTPSDENLHNAAYSSKDDSTYQNPVRVDEFIEKMASYHNIKEGELKCATANDSNVVSRVYVFPDKKEVDVFGRLLQVACWYSDETPGYHLNFSHQQFFFELKDQRKQLQYRWIAERINGSILLYSTNAPVGAQTTSACYQEYRNELMHINSINLKTKEI